MLYQVWARLPTQTGLYSGQGRPGRPVQAWVQSGTVRKFVQGVWLFRHYSADIMKRVQAIGPKLLQWINIHFCVKLGWTLDDIFLSLQHVYGQACLHRQTVRFWFNAFVNGRRIVDQFRAHKCRTGCSPQNVAAVRAAVERDRTLTIATLHRQTNIPTYSIQRILTKDLQLTRRSAKFVPALLTPNHLRQQMDASQSMLRALRTNANIMKRIVTMDETWVYMYDPESKVQSSQWLPKGVPRPTKVHCPRAVGKCMLITFFD